MEIYFRAFELEDYKLINKWRNDPEIQNLTCGNVLYVSPEMGKKWVEDKILNNQKNIYLGICLKKTNELIGYYSINDIDHKNQKAIWGGIVIGKKELWGKNMATIAAEMMLKYVFEELNINCYWGFVLEENQTSRKMLKRLGFSEIGVLEESLFKHNRMQSQIIVSMLRSDYQKRKNISNA
jgi:[ribosomal protein S5]-alanine N-acetyltransferase